MLHWLVWVCGLPLKGKCAWTYHLAPHDFWPERYNLGNFVAAAVAKVFMLHWPVRWTCDTSNISELSDLDTIILLSDHTCPVTSIFADSSVKWKPIDFIHGSIDNNNFIPLDVDVCIVHPSLFMSPDIKVYSQLGFPMLNSVMQATPTCAKPSPATARRDQTKWTR